MGCQCLASLMEEQWRIHYILYHIIYIILYNCHFNRIATIVVLHRFSPENSWLYNETSWTCWMVMEKDMAQSPRFFIMVQRGCTDGGWLGGVKDWSWFHGVRDICILYIYIYRFIVLVYIYIYMCVCIQIFTYIYICITQITYIYIYIHVFVRDVASFLWPCPQTTWTLYHPLLKESSLTTRYMVRSMWVEGGVSLPCKMPCWKILHLVRWFSHSDFHLLLGFPRPPCYIYASISSHHKIPS